MNDLSSNLPIACHLSDSEFRAREATLIALFRSTVIATEDLQDGYVFHFPGAKNSLATVCELMVAERECCPFLTFELAAQPNTGPVSLRVTGPFGTKHFLQTIFCSSEPNRQANAVPTVRSDPHRKSP
jgi:hypothetical protein